jgi:opacity protein-like surface antigen
VEGRQRSFLLWENGVYGANNGNCAERDGKLVAKNREFLIFKPMRMNMTNTPRLGTCVKILTACIALALGQPHANAGTEMTSSKDMKGMTPPECGPHDWTLELGSGASWSNVRSGQPNQSYTIVPINLTASLKLDDVSLDNMWGGVLRGYSEFFFRGQYEQIVHGPENHYEGLMVGPRYNFVQPGWKIIPYVEGGVGIGFADSNPALGGLGQDFNFSFSAGAGFKYLINCNWFARLGVDYQHVSNAGLSDPIPNHPIDALGPQLSIGYAF